jgi:hypothetical protein
MTVKRHVKALATHALDNGERSVRLFVHALVDYADIDALGTPTGTRGNGEPR